jgi:hypothetical protein
MLREVQILFDGFGDVRTKKFGSISALEHFSSE